MGLNVDFPTKEFPYFEVDGVSYSLETVTAITVAIVKRDFTVTLVLNKGALAYSATLYKDRGISHLSAFNEAINENYLLSKYFIKVGEDYIAKKYITTFGVYFFESFAPGKQYKVSVEVNYGNELSTFTYFVSASQKEAINKYNELKQLMTKG